MNWIHLTWSMQVREENERNDHPQLQFALITIKDGQVIVHDHHTGKRLRKGKVLHWGSIRSGRSVPTPENPYFGIVVRAIELDNSRGNRKDDRNLFFEDIRSKSQAIFDSGRVPTANDLLEFGLRRLKNDLGDDDDRIGVNARAFPEYGSLISSETPDWIYHYNLSFTDEREGRGYLSTAKHIRNLPFRENGAFYNLSVDLIITPNEPVPSYP